MSEKNGAWVARINLRNGKKVIRIRRTLEDAEAAIVEMMAANAADLGPLYALALGGKVLPKQGPGPRAGLRPRTRWEVMERDGHRCAYCGAGPADARLVVDHVVALAEGGTHDPANLVTACWECNTGKGRSRPVSER